MSENKPLLDVRSNSASSLHAAVDYFPLTAHTQFNPLLSGLRIVCFKVNETTYTPAGKRVPLP